MLLATLRAWLRRLLRRPAPPAPRKGPYVSRAGLAMQSQGEVLIANWLDARGYAWEYEPWVAGYRPDFALREERILIEYFGMKGHSRRYDAKIAQKKRRYRHHGWTVIGVEPRHLGRLDERLGKRLTRPRRKS